LLYERRAAICPASTYGAVTGLSICTNCPAVRRCATHIGAAFGEVASLHSCAGPVWINHWSHGFHGGVHRHVQRTRGPVLRPGRRHTTNCPAVSVTLRTSNRSQLTRRVNLALSGRAQGYFGNVVGLGASMCNGPCPVGRYSLAAATVCINCAAVRGERHGGRQSPAQLYRSTDDQLCRAATAPPVLWASPRALPRVRLAVIAWRWVVLRHCLLLQRCATRSTPTCAGLLCLHALRGGDVRLHDGNDTIHVHGW